MDVSGKVVVITGGARGIGRAIAEAMIAAGAKVAIADLNGDMAQATAAQIGARGYACDVTREDQVVGLIDNVEADLGPIDLFHSNAGVGFGDPDHAASASNEIWQLSWDVHVMAHVYAARALIPRMTVRGGGYLVNTASAAGLLSQIGDAAYSATKHAAVSLAESLAITHRDDGIRVSVLCPQYVATAMIGYDTPSDAPDHPGLITPADVAATVMLGIAEEQFLMLPHPIVEDYWQAKVQNYERWLGGMRKLRRRAIEQTGGAKAINMHKLV